MIVPNMAGFQQGTVTAYLVIRDGKRDIGEQLSSGTVSLSLLLPAPSVPCREALKASKYHRSHLNIKLKEPCRVCSIKINYLLQMQKTIRCGKDGSSEQTSTWEFCLGGSLPNLTLTEHMLLFLSTELHPVLTEERPVFFIDTKNAPG